MNIPAFALIDNVLKNIETNSRGKWNYKTNMPMPRQNLSCSPVNNKIYCFGGTSNADDNAYVYVDQCVEYDPTTDTFTTKASDPTSKRARMTTSAVNNKIYCIGGAINNMTTSIVEEYDSLTNTWSTKATAPFTVGDAVSGAINNKIYVACANSNVGEYDPLTNTWATKASTGYSRSRLSGDVVNNKLYFIGGVSFGGNDNQEYDPSTNTWSTKATMPTARLALTCSAVNNKLYFIGGQPLGMPSYMENDYSIVEEYNPLTNTWDSNKTKMLDNRVFFTSSTVNNKIYCFGGTNKTSSPTYVFNTVLEFNPEDNYVLTLDSLNKLKTAKSLLAI